MDLVIRLLLITAIGFLMHAVRSFAPAAEGRFHGPGVILAAGFVLLAAFVVHPPPRGRRASEPSRCWKEAATKHGDVHADVVHACLGLAADVRMPRGEHRQRAAADAEYRHTVAGTRSAARCRETQMLAEQIGQRRRLTADKGDIGKLTADHDVTPFPGEGGTCTAQLVQSRGMPSTQTVDVGQGAAWNISRACPARKSHRNGGATQWTRRSSGKSSHCWTSIAS